MEHLNLILSFLSKEVIAVISVILAFAILVFYSLNFDRGHWLKISAYYSGLLGIIYGVYNIFENNLYFLISLLIGLILVIFLQREVFNHKYAKIEKFEKIIYTLVILVVNVGIIALTLLEFFI
jgi:hypothetical protein